LKPSAPSLDPPLTSTKLLHLLFAVKIILESFKPGHLTGSPKFAEHVTSTFFTLSAVVVQVAVFVPDSMLLPLAMFNGMLALPHTVTLQVNVTGSLPDAVSELMLHVGVVTAEI